MGRLLDEDDVIRAVDKHTDDDNVLDDDITCVLENVPTAQSLNWIPCDMPEPYRPKMTPQKAAEILKNERACVLSKMCERTECKNCAFMIANEMLDALNMAIEVLQEKEK